MSNDIYVIVVTNDQKHMIAGKEFYDDLGPLVFEQYTKTADLESIKNRIKFLDGTYGKCRIAKLEFID